MNDAQAQAPTPESITSYIVLTFPGVDAFSALGATFFSLDPENHWPNFATIVTTDEHDMGTPSNLSRPGVFRLNIGLSTATFRDLVGAEKYPDYAALDRLLPHPVYARQHWVSVLNPSAATFDQTVKPLLSEAYTRVAKTAGKQATKATSG